MNYRISNQSLALVQEAIANSIKEAREIIIGAPVESEELGFLRVHAWRGCENWSAKDSLGYRQYSGFIADKEWTIKIYATGDN